MRALRVQCTIDAMLDSAARGGVWTSVAAYPDP
jgi:hypothetical protein